jgi:hypothetical protein
MSSKKYEESGYQLVLDLLTISYKSRVSYPRRSGSVGKSKPFKTHLSTLPQENDSLPLVSINRELLIFVIPGYEFSKAKQHE